MRRKMSFTISKYLFLFQRYSSFQNMQISQVTATTFQAKSVKFPMKFQVFSLKLTFCMNKIFKTWAKPLQFLYATEQKFSPSTV